MKKIMERLGQLLELGGIKKDIACLVISGAAVICSLLKLNLFPFDIAWIAIILCGIPKMEEKIMLLKLIGLIIGALVFGAGIYYLEKEKDDPESRKIYTIISVIGSLIAIVCALLLILA